MTFAQYQEIFKTKYPDGRTWMHNEVCGDVAHYKQKVAVEFVPGGKVFFYSGAYEDVLCKVGVPTISKSRLDSLESTLKHLLDTDGKADEFFGIVVDNSAEIERLTKEIKQIKATHVVVGRAGD